MFYLNMSLPFSSSDWAAKWLTNFVFYHIYDEIIFMRDVRIASARKYFFASTLLSRFSSSFTWSLSLVRLSLVSLSHDIKTKKHNTILVKKLQSSINGQHLVIQEKRKECTFQSGAYIYLTCSFLNTTTYANQPELNLVLISAKKKLITTEWPENNYCDKTEKN